MKYFFSFMASKDGSQIFQNAMTETKKGFKSLDEITAIENDIKAKHGYDNVKILSFNKL